MPRRNPTRDEMEREATEEAYAHVKRALAGVRKALEGRYGPERSALLYGHTARAAVAYLRLKVISCRGFGVTGGSERCERDVRSAYKHAQQLEALSKRALRAEKSLTGAMAPLSRADKAMVRAAFQGDQEHRGVSDAESSLENVREALSSHLQFWFPNVEQDFKDIVGSLSEVLDTMGLKAGSDAAFSVIKTV